MPKPRPYPKKPTESHPEVFIIESLAMDEERKGAFEGKALYESLKTLGKQPLYYYVRSAQELDRALSLFRHSKYNFLHFSLHGNSKSVFTTLDELSNAEFANLTAKKLPNRRVTFSACALGAGSLVTDVQSKNKGVESIAAPLDKIDMHMALPFWLSFYCRALHENGMNFTGNGLKTLLEPLCSYFGIRLNVSGAPGTTGGRASDMSEMSDYDIFDFDPITEIKKRTRWRGTFADGHEGPGAHGA